MVRLKEFSLWCLISIVVLALACLHICVDTAHAEAVVTEEEGWIQNPTNGHYYKLTDPMSWSEAEEQAIQWGGHLVTVNDADENEWLVSTFGGVEELWIGYTDKDIEGDWRWISGEDSTFTNWVYHNSGCGVWEPNDSPRGEDFAAMNWNRPIGYEGPCYAPDHAPGKWNDLPISSIARGIVEISSSCDFSQNLELNDVLGGRGLNVKGFLFHLTKMRVLVLLRGI